ncbi:MAG: exosortase/archaeosortase family protein [Planctomycetales bacterium]
MSSTLTLPAESANAVDRDDSAAAAAVPRAGGLRPVLAPLAVVGACVAIYWPTLAALPAVWELDPNYSHGYAIPFASLLFAWRAWRRHGLPVAARVDWSDAPAGVVRMLLGFAVHAGCLFAELPFFDVLSLVLVLTGALGVLGGRAAQRAYGFPVFFLIFMAPLPLPIYNWLALNLQEFASAAGAFLLQAGGVPVFREGCHIQIPGYAMEVGAACSGLRQLTAIVALSLATGHLSGRRWAYKWALGLSSIPIAVAANCIRVTLTGYIMLWFGRKWAEDMYHTLEGLAMVGVAAVLLLMTAGFLAWLLPEKGSKVEG